MNEFDGFIEGLIVPLALSVFGGIARLCRNGFRSWSQIFSGIIISAFTGVVVHLAIQDMNLSASMQAAIIAASGYSGGAVIDGLIEQITGRLRAHIEHKWDGVERRRGDEEYQYPDSEDKQTQEVVLVQDSRVRSSTVEGASVESGRDIVAAAPENKGIQKDSKDGGHV